MHTNSVQRGLNVPRLAWSGLDDNGRGFHCARIPPGLSGLSRNGLWYAIDLKPALVLRSTGVDGSLSSCDEVGSIPIGTA